MGTSYFADYTDDGFDRAALSFNDLYAPVMRFAAPSSHFPLEKRELESNLCRADVMQQNNNKTAR